MSRLHTADPVVAAYTEIVTNIEHLALAGVPAPLRRVAKGLTPQQRHDLAIGLANAARLAARQETSR